MNLKDSTLNWKMSHEADVTNLHPSLWPKFTKVIQVLSSTFLLSKKKNIYIYIYKKKKLILWLHLACPFNIRAKCIIIIFLK